MQMDNIWILAQAPGEETSGGIDSEAADAGVAETKQEVSDSNTPRGKGRGGGFFGPYGNFIFLALMFVMFYLILFRGPRKKQQKHRQMVQTLQKNDRVRTIGGIIGVVVDVKGDEITLKVDESNNTKIKVISSAIGKNLSKDK
jgi:preprotein translocase subunit YajC